jgi:hypothetical protein
MSTSTDVPQARLVLNCLRTLVAGADARWTAAADRLAVAAADDEWYILVVDRIAWCLDKGTARWPAEDRLLAQIAAGNDPNLDLAFEDLRNAEWAVTLTTTDHTRAGVTAQLLRWVQALAEWRRAVEPQACSSWLIESGLHAIAWSDDELSPMATAEWNVSVARERRRMEQELRRRQR